MRVSPPSTPPALLGTSSVPPLRPSVCHPSFEIFSEGEFLPELTDALVQLVALLGASIARELRVRLLELHLAALAPAGEICDHIRADLVKGWKQLHQSCAISQRMRESQGCKVQDRTITRSHRPRTGQGVTGLSEFSGCYRRLINLLIELIKAAECIPAC